MQEQLSRATQDAKAEAGIQSDSIPTAGRNIRLDSAPASHHWKYPHTPLLDYDGIGLFTPGFIGLTPEPWLEDPMLLTAVLLPDPEGGFTASNPETGSTSQGNTVEEALENLREATELYLEEFPSLTNGRPLITTFEIASHV